MTAAAFHTFSFNPPFALILIGVFPVAIDIKIGVQPDSHRRIFVILGVIVIILIIAAWIGNFLVLCAYIFFIIVGFFRIALDALTTGIFRNQSQTKTTIESN
jgi:hypothetical protein